MRKEILLACILLVAATPAYADPGGVQAQDGSDKKTITTDKATTHKDSQHEHTDVGNGQTHRSDKGHRTSNRNEKSHTKERVKSAELRKEINLPTLFYRSLVNKYPEFLVTIDSLLINPVDADGIVDATQSDFYGKIAQGRAVCDEFIHKDRVLAIMSKMIRAGVWIRKQAQGWKFTDTLGYEDLGTLINATVEGKAHLIDREQEKFNISGACRFVGDYNVIQCGQCIIDVSNRNGMPELTCAGQKVFANGEAGGMRLAIAVTESASETDANSTSHSNERYQSISDAADNYIRFAVQRDKGVEAVQVKKVLMEKSVTNSTRVDMAIQAMKDKSDPEKVLQMLKF